ncbi:uncharacterized protein TRIVIDRAFT_40085 [Trichoderma virens Gv29-8]|uniref:D-arabinitol 2-dehydrogenase [ribulose-forming] n=1 Tax=Hypocrea virens (strain Gv29-8 / FGSC 10586) TaxID=413071 RepID=G9NBX0_HYPVG|nr:uncharacterized protein TRIVIDRAFT_40085 [Trichoderma virens Gv29-8]EHK16323.1 hypothetical protein TRIVIDRAFT_40085 [Trichoderma virens Gv29-8]
MAFNRVQATLTPKPTQTMPNSQAGDMAKLRFKVEGNAIITGGAGTLGIAAARALLEHGLTGLMIFDRTLAQAESEIEQLRVEYPSAKILSKQVDIIDEVAVSSAVIDTAELLGSVNILLCFAGVVGCVHAVEITAAEWRRTLEINTTGSFLCAQAVAKQIILQGTGGSIVFIASISGHRVNFPQPQVAYNTSKAAVLAMKNSLAAEWARYGIRVNSISPGYMDTILNEGDGIADARAVWADRNPMGRMGQPNELTGLVVLLASNASSYMNGTDIICDGGQVLL